jgi:GNAT superfamily N-acetyltransferase
MFNPNPNDTTTPSCLQDAVFDNDTESYTDIENTIMSQPSLFPHIAAKIGGASSGYGGGGLYDVLGESADIRVITLITEDDQAKLVTAGFVVFSDHSRDADDAGDPLTTKPGPDRSIYALAVYPDYRNRGFGKKLYMSMEGCDGTDDPQLTKVLRPSTITYSADQLVPGSVNLVKWLKGLGFAHWEGNVRDVDDEAYDDGGHPDPTVRHAFSKSFAPVVRQVSACILSFGP